MKKRKLQKKVPAYTFGVESLLASGGLEQLLGGLGGGTGTGSTGGAGLESILSGFLGKSGATGTQTVAGASSQDLQGLGVITSLGLPILTDKIGLSEDTTSVVNSVAKYSGIGAQYGGPIGAGIGAVVGGGLGWAGANANKRRRTMEKRNKNQIERTKVHAQNAGISDEMSYDYTQGNPIIPTFKYGTDLAYVNDKEILQHSSGDLSKVNGNPNIPDSELINMQNVTAVLSDDLMRLNKKETFADAGNKLMKIAKRTKGTNSVARTTKDLNQKFVDRETEKLKFEQHVQKTLTGKKQSYKTIPKHRFGTSNIEDDDNILFDFNQAEYPNMLPEAVVTTQSPSKFSIKKLPGTGGLGSRIKQKGTGSGATVTNTSANLLNTNPIVNPNVKINKDLAVVPSIDQNKGGANIMNGVQSLLTDYLALAPQRYNTQKGNEGYDVVSPTVNPYNARVNNLMRARRISMAPARESINRQRSIGRYNSNSIINTGQRLAYNLANESLLGRAELDSINQAQQVNNQYVGDYANSLRTMGNEYVNSKVHADDATARNEAASEAYRATAATQLGQFAQNKQLMSNQQNRDQGILKAMEPFLGEGFSQDKLAEILKMLG